MKRGVQIKPTNPAKGRQILRFMYFLILTLIIFVFFDRAVYILYRNISTEFYNKPSDDSADMKISQKERNFYDTLILGSSRAKKSIYPYYLNKYLGLKAKKIADSGKYPRYNLRYYKIYRKNYKIPRFVIYGIDYFIFRHTSNLTRMKRMLGFRTKSKFRNEFRIDLKLFNPFRHPSLIIRDKSKINNFMMDYLEYISTNKRRSKGISLISENRGSKRTALPRDILEPPIWDKTPYTRFPGNEGEHFLLLLKELEKDNVKVFIVIIPDIIGVYRTNYERKIFEKEIRSICSRFRNITLFNYNSPEKFNLSDPKLFRDGKFGERVCHLSYFGAEQFGKILCDDISVSTGFQESLPTY